MKRLNAGILANFVAKLVAIGLLCSSAVFPASAKDLLLHCDPSQSAANFTLSDTLHTVHGSFQQKRGELHFDPATGKISGEIVFDANSGKTGNDDRDKKMKKDVLESERYPEISFRPDRVDGSVAAEGSSRAQIHGLFGIHGAEHEMTVPITVKFDGGHWEATAKFIVPYVKWGMKDPSILFLRVGDTVEIDLHAAGNVTP